ncbi:MAG: MFS transporter [Solobacterium sp.]|jgi:MFS family permease|nr:MFS transporter [Solobacterium sp.]MCH4206091.1 MFS transporter [Solobacterium sp.]MCH4227557.1 MFS transporter [Solobacterium sp.]MCH4282981.1 MFS transporter [Solobacterium sp.]
MTNTDTEEHMNWHYILIAAVCAAYAGVTLGIISNCAGVFLQPVAKGIQCGIGDLSLSITVMSLVTAFSGMLVTKLLKRFALSRLCITGSILCAVCCFMMAGFQSLWEFILAGIVLGFASSLFGIIPINIMLENWFHKGIGRITGIVLSASGLISALMCPLFGKIIASYSWRQAYIFMGIVILIMALPGSFFVRLKPQELGMKPYGAYDDSRPNKAVDSTESKGTWKKKIFITGAVTVFIACVVGLGSHISSIAVQAGADAEFSSLMMSFSMIGNVGSKLLLGVLCDRYGTVNSLILYTIVCISGIIELMLMLLGTVWMGTIGSLSFGFIYAIGSVGLPLIVAKMAGKERFPEVFSKIQMVYSTLNAGMITVHGMIYDAAGSYMPSLIITMGMLLMLIINLCMQKRMWKDQ